MENDPVISSADRTTVIFDSGPSAALRCAHCGEIVSDADAECPSCDTPIDWGASSDALRAWQQRT
jgi:uncharacterized OB-fold protein